MAVNPEATKKLYQDMENDLGLIIQQQENSPSVTARMKDSHQNVRDQGPGQQSESSGQKEQKDSTH